MYIIKNINAFCIFQEWNEEHNEMAFCTGGTFAARAFSEGRDMFREVQGNKFDWFSTKDGLPYCDAKGNFSRPSEERIIMELYSNDAFEKYALEHGLVEWVDTPPRQISEKERQRAIDRYLHEQGAYDFPKESDVIPDLGDK